MNTKFVAMETTYEKAKKNVSKYSQRMIWIYESPNNAGEPETQGERKV